MPMRPEPRLIHQNCPKCGDMMHITVRDERANKHGAKCNCGWEGFVREEATQIFYPQSPRRRG